jgi:hypothetical protein
MPVSPETAQFLAQPYTFLERARSDGIATLVFEDTEAAKYFHRQLRALNWGRAKPLGCVLRRHDNVVTAATDESLMPDARYVEPQQSA